MTDRAYAFLKEKLQNCEYMPGDTLNEKKLCECIDCGRTPVREALLKLRDEELVEIFPRKAIRAAQFTHRKVSEIYQLRKLLEPTICAQHWPRISQEALLDFDRRFAALDPADARACYALDTQFHRTLIAAADNRTLNAFFDTLMQVQYRLGMYTSRLGTAATGSCRTEHHEIIEALLSGDGARITQALTTHADCSARLALKTLQAAGDV